MVFPRAGRRRALRLFHLTKYISHIDTSEATGMNRENDAAVTGGRELSGGTP
jgi:hypothetical protein